jgi:hypothetical protein
MTFQFSRRKLQGPTAVGFALLSGCAYRLPVLNVPSQERLMIIAKSPERYVVRIKASVSADFPVASDGRVTIHVPPLPRACSIYLFDLIKISEGIEPSKTKSIQLIDGADIVAKLSLTEIAKLPPDVSGYHIVQFKK